MADPTGKLAPALAEHVDHLDGAQPVEVVVELTPAPAAPAEGSRAQRVAAARAAFDQDLTTVTGTVAAAGGEVLDSAWLNRTIRARVPAGRVGTVAADDAVAAVDLPHALEADGTHPASSDPAP